MSNEVYDALQRTLFNICVPFNEMVREFIILIIGNKSIVIRYTRVMGETYGPRPIVMIKFVFSIVLNQWTFEKKQLNEWKFGWLIQKIQIL